MEANLDIQGNPVSYDSSINYLAINRIPPEFRNDSTPLVKKFDPRSLEELAHTFIEQGRPQMLGEVVERDFICLYQDLKEGRLSYVNSWRDETIGKTSDLTPEQIVGLENTLNLYRSVLRAIGQTSEMELRKMIYGDREFPKELVLDHLEGLSGCRREVMIEIIDNYLDKKISEELRGILIAKRKEFEE
ncbi:MAG: hypothetical protein AABY07_00660 [Nanoarchaeota archaeon]